MECQHCGASLPKGTRAKQGTVIPCPICGKQTKVTYSLKDQLRDPIGVFVWRDLKYASPLFTILGGILIVLLLLIAIFLCRE